jgi:hypothetical protein
MFHHLALFILLIISAASFQAFQIPSKRLQLCLTQVLAKKVKRRSLGSIAEDGVVSTPKKVKKASSAESVFRSKSSATKTGSVSTELARWAATKQNGNASDDITSQDIIDESGEDVAEFIPFESSTSDRRVKQSELIQLGARRDQAIKELIEELDQVLEGNNNLDEILAVARRLMRQESVPLKTLTAGAKTLNYRLAWVGSDDAICHLGTGLHKVPLARLQEIFFTLQGKSNVQVYEVISVLGPFPNIRNTLLGKCKVSSGQPSGLKIIWESMMDGTGKDIAAGKDEDKQRVDLQVYFSDENAILGVVPPKEGGTRVDPMESNGSHVLLFVREDNMDDRLDSLRVL